jgi:hypothetical protein
MIDTETIAVMIEQMKDGDYSVFDTTKAMLEMDVTEKETKELMKLFNEAYKEIELVGISDIQMSLALYVLQSKEKDFIMWLYNQTELVAKGKKTMKEFFAIWDKAYPRIHLKLGNAERFDQLMISNMITFVNDLKED